MAAQALVRRSYLTPLDTYSINVMGTANLLEVIRSAPHVKAVLIVTSDKCYENNEWSWGYREIERLGGYDPYSNSKACAELVTAAFRSSFFDSKQNDPHGAAIATVRAGNVIGGGDWSSDRLVPDILATIERGEILRLRNPAAIRPWQHVLEPLSGYLVLVEHLFGEQGASYAEAWNFGPSDDDVRSVEWICQRTMKLWESPVSWVCDDRSHPHEANYLKLDCSKAKSRLGWQPRWNLDKALSEIVSWHRSHMQGENMRDKSIAQISDFESISV